MPGGNQFLLLSEAIDMVFEKGYRVFLALCLNPVDAGFNCWCNRLTVDVLQNLRLKYGQTAARERATVKSGGSFFFAAEQASVAQNFEVMTESALPDGKNGAELRDAK